MEKTTAEAWRESPTAWFAALESALRRGDYEAAAVAARNLRRLGMVVVVSPTCGQEVRDE